MTDTVIVLWLRDLRLADNPALHYAAEGGFHVVPLFIHDKERTEEGAAGRWWLHHSLIALDRDLQRLGSRLIVRQGDFLRELAQVARETGAFAIYWNTLYEPSQRLFEQRIKEWARNEGIATKGFNGSLLGDPDKIFGPAKEPLRSFGPFLDACRAQQQTPFPLDAPRSMNRLEAGLSSLPIDALGLCAGSRWVEDFHAHWEPSERAANEALSDFLGRGLAHYAQWREVISKKGTSRLSPYIHWGQLSPRQLLWAVSQAREEELESFLRQLYWREFAYYLLFHFPHAVSEPLDKEFQDFPWRRDPLALEAWSQGETGIPLVDAGMRELLSTGWMHHRTRVILASFLTKNLLIHWREGMQHFMGNSVDADLACNVLGWQWVAGCAGDGIPFFRIFNPASQADRFDPDGAYVRHWLPELARLPDSWLHHPWDAPEAVRVEAGVWLGENYPDPIIDLRASRHRAIDLWAQRREPG